MLCKKCKKCKTKMQLCGFERKLITKGKDKGASYVQEYYTCSNINCCTNKSTVGEKGE